MTYAPLVKYIAYRKVRELPASCQVEDFISCGLEALITAIDRYDPEKGATLEQFAWTRIHGAILDELRRQDWAPRSVRRWERDIEGARRNFVGVHGRPPTREELADSLGTTAGELREREQKIATSDLTSLNAIVPGEEDSNVERVDTLAADDISTNPEHVASMGDAKDRFRAPSAGSRAASARSRSCSTSRSSPSARSARSSGSPRAASARSTPSSSARCARRSARTRRCSARWRSAASGRPGVQAVGPDQGLRHRDVQLRRHDLADVEARQRLGECRVLAHGDAASRAASRIARAASPAPAATTSGASVPST